MIGRTSRRHPDAPPPPKPVDAADPVAPTTQEWREAAREQAARRAGWLRWGALALSLPFLAGGLWAFPLVYLWRVLCVRVPVARRWGVLWALPALAAAYLFPQAVLGPTLELARLPLSEQPVVGAARLPVPDILKPGAPLVETELVYADPFPPLRGHLTASWPPGLVWAALLAAGWGLAGWLEGAKLRPRSAREVQRAAARALRRGDREIERGLLVRGYIAMLFARQGTGKTEYLCWLIASHPGVVFYVLTEQTDATLAPYLLRWGLTDRRGLHLVTRDAADQLWRAHGHQTSAAWEHLGPMALDDAGRRGADVFVMDTWTAWTGGTQDAKGIQAAMAPIREAVGRWGYAFLSCGHTNKEGELLGSKEFERLCDISLGGEVVEGTEVRRLWWVKDRSPANLKGQSVHLVRDLSGPFPCYREATEEELSGGGFGGKSREANSNSSSTERVFRVLEAGPATVAELCAAAELAQPTVSGALTKLEASGLAARIGKKGRADLWRVRGEEEDDGRAAVAS